MSELALHGAELNVEPDLIQAGISPGALIREARESSGVHVDVLAAALKITVDRLEALESDHYALLPDMVFARALASSACRILKMDPTHVLALMPKNQTHSLTSGRPDINATFKDGSENQVRKTFLRQLTRPLGLAVIVLLVGAAVLFFLPKRSEMSDTVVVAPAQTLSAAQIDENLKLSQSTPMTQKPEIQAEVATNALVTDVVTDKKTSDVPTASVTAEADVSSVVVGGLLEFRAREATWVQVRDATKAVVFERTLSKGASANASGVLPLSVVVGRADSTDVFVRGAPFALTSVAKENVARFEVK